MRNLLKSKYLTSAIVYTGTSGLLALLPLLLLPIITNHVPASGYGIYVTYVLISKIMCSAVSLGYIECVAREFSCSSPNEFSKYYSNALYNVSAWSILVLGAVAFLTPFIEYDFDIPLYYFPFLVLIAYSQFIINSLLSIFQMSSKPVYFGFIKVLLFFLEYGVVFFVLTFRELSHLDLLNAYMLSHLLVVTLSLVVLIKRGFLTLNCNVKLFDSNLRYSLPLVPHELSGLILSFSDRLMINHFMGTSAVAVYAIGYQFGQVISLIDTAVNKSWIPWLYKELQKDCIRMGKIFLSCSLYVVGLVLLSLLVCFLGSYIVVSFYSAEYVLASEVVLYIAFAFVVFGIYKIFAGFLFFHKKTKVLGLLTSLTVVCNIFLSTYLIPEFGISGAAYSTLASFVILCFCVGGYFFIFLNRRNEFS